MKRRKLKKAGSVVTVAALAASLALGSFCLDDITVEAESSFADEFANAVEDDESGLWMRWWFKDGDLSYDAIYADMKNMVDEGVVRIEIQKNFTWTDSEEKMNAFYYVLKIADELGVTLDFATGDAYPAVTGTTTLEVDGTVYYDPDDIDYDSEKDGVKSMHYAYKEVGDALENADLLTDVSAYVSSGWSGSALQTGQTISINGENGEKIFGISANYIASDGTTILGALDLTDNSDIITYSQTNGLNTGAAATVTADELTALCTESEQEAIAGDTDGSWKIFVYYTEKESNSVCYLSYYSTRTWTRWFEEGVIDNDDYWTEVLGLAEGEVHELFEKVGGAVWEDSLESINISYTDYAGIDEDGNSYDIFESFEQICGYEFPVERLVTLFVNGGSNYEMSGGFSEDADFVYDSVKDKQLRGDYYEVLTEAYSMNHLQVYTDWAAEYGMGTRVQAAYMYALDQDEAYSHVTIPEQETLNATDYVDIYRGVAGAAHSNGSNVISLEMGARAVFFQGETYTVAWYDWLWHANNAYMGGVNSVLPHGTEYSYASSTDTWPGPCMSMTSGGLAEPTGQRMPYKEVMKDTVSSYLAREQMILQSGTADVDVAIYYYYMEYGNDYLEYFTDDCLETAGYTYDFLGDTSLATTAAASDGDVLSPDGAAYDALVINQYASNDGGVDGQGSSTSAFTGNGYMTLESAQAVKKMADQGLAIVIVGDAPDKSPLASDDYVDGEYKEGYSEAQIQAIFAEILTYDNVVQVESEADVADALAALSVEPDSAYDEEYALENNADYGSVDLYTVHRSDDNVDYYMLFNRSHTVYWEGEEYDEDTLNANKDHTIATYVEFDAEEGSVPYLLDAWTGEVERIADYTITEDGKYRIYVELDASDTTIIAIGTTAWYTDGLGDVVTASADGADLSYDADGNLIASSDTAGTYTVTLNNGETAEITIDSVPETISLSDGSVEWNLDLKLYKPTDEWIENPTTDYNYYDYEETGESGITTITYEYIDDIDPVGEDGLDAWVDLEELGDDPERASGVGYYTVTVTLPEDYDSSSQGYILNFDEVTELYTVTVNGTQVIFDQTSSYETSGDITDYLVAGENTIEVTVASGLFNAAKYYNTNANAINSSIVAEQSQNDWTSLDGIIGDVTLTGYAKVNVMSSGDSSDDTDDGNGYTDDGSDDTDDGNGYTDDGSDDTDDGTGYTDDGSDDADNGTEDTDDGSDDTDDGTDDTDDGSDDADGTDDADDGSDDADDSTGDADDSDSSDTTDATKTGDGSPVSAYAVTICLAAAAIAAAVFFRRRKFLNM